MPAVTPPLHRWRRLRDLPLRPLEGGLINDSFAAGDPPVAAVQRLHTIFRPELHDDIEVVTRWIEREGMTTPRLIPTDDGPLCVVDDEGRCWRAMSWVQGVTHHRLRKPALAAAAGALVGRWHAVTRDLVHDFAFTRPGAHDTGKHMATLEASLADRRGHALWDAVARVADGVLDGWARWQGRLDGPTRIAHGDLKISNLLFDEEGAGICLLDLDTIANLPLDVEMGDALRSWCNPAGEDVEDAGCAPELFAAAAGAWAAECRPAREELQAIVPGVERICLELAARFAADALQEAYFGWDRARFRTRGEHNLLRARGQLSLARSVAAQRGALEASLRGR